MTPEQRNLARAFGLTEKEANEGADIGRRSAQRYLAEHGIPRGVTPSSPSSIGASKGIVIIGLIVLVLVALVAFSLG